MTILRTDSTHSGITIDCANGSGFVHGGSGPLTVYSDKSKKTITVNGKTMNVKDFFLNDNLNSVKWYYKRVDSYLSYYKVWNEEDAKACIEMTFEMIEGVVDNIIDVSITNKITDAIYEEE